MKLDTIEVLHNLVHPERLLDDFDYFNYLELRDKAPAQAQAILDNALCDYYRAIRPSGRYESNEDILKNKAEFFIRSIITEEVVRCWYDLQNIKYEAITGVYDTKAEVDKFLLGQPDFLLADGGHEVKSTYKDTMKWIGDMYHYNSLDKLHSSDYVVLFSGIWFSYTTNTLTWKGTASLMKGDNLYDKVTASEKIIKDLDMIMNTICNKVGIKCKLTHTQFTV